MGGDPLPHAGPARCRTPRCSTRDTIERMRSSGPPTEVVELPGIGHAPSLMAEDQIAIVREFLLRTA